MYRKLWYRPNKKRRASTHKGPIRNKYNDDLETTCQL